METLRRLLDLGWTIDLRDGDTFTVRNRGGRVVVIVARCDD